MRPFLSASPRRLWFDYDGVNLEAVSWTLDFAGSDWYVVQPGDSFDVASIKRDLFPLILKFGDSRGPIFIGDGDIYLGFATGAAPPSIRDVFGWVHLRGEQVIDLSRPPLFVTGRLQMITNTVAYNSSGIIVGTPDAHETLTYPYPPDFNQDGWTNGPDYLVWQRGGSPNPVHPFELVACEERSGTKNTPGRNTAVPEPATKALLILLIVASYQFRQLGRRVASISAKRPLR